ncbi:uncharacterized protein BO96DRAFT_494330 [Aspergillus niger CBS 101883]|uniref:uncharacterized protein n=1 Tax=Aspergillus lacticoffeatus (strain CBS 101883) TaxID=1450533 RepID=UPI000D7EC916|nr:uncharacterized protein BO96DRAFT_494330 [Aspergillus niger CBS 101883]PYH50117.1 hypothetical protein BO96DRAFT_494330 [Aspergillus niger CBS 101883]
MELSGRHYFVSPLGRYKAGPAFGGPDGIAVGWRILMQDVDLPGEMRYGQADTLLLGISSSHLRLYTQHNLLSSKGKSRYTTDEQLAVHLQYEEWRNISQYLQDKRIAMRFAAAVQSDGDVLAATKMKNRMLQEPDSA